MYIKDGPGHIYPDNQNFFFDPKSKIGFKEKFETVRPILRISLSLLSLPFSLLVFSHLCIQFLRVFSDLAEIKRCPQYMIFFGSKNVPKIFSSKKKFFF
ncbi:unnamed protein product [Meloidogyne enterolobii]|uniref:Uncharacterized protein n=1 Tax=Meloidogyne enterolobii TaxID=390850 RepID=A0ACB0Y9C6_MELEN